MSSFKLASLSMGVGCVARVCVWMLELQLCFWYCMADVRAKCERPGVFVPGLMVIFNLI